MEELNGAYVDEVMGVQYLTSFTGISLSETGMNLGSRLGRVGKKKGASLGCLGGSIGLLRNYK